MTADPLGLLLIDQSAEPGGASGILADAGFRLQVVEAPVAGLSSMIADMTDIALVVYSAADPQACARLREQAALAALPILLLCTSAVDDDARLAALSSGADAVLAWPCSAGLLTASAYALLRSHASASELRRQLADERQSQEEFLSVLGHELRTPLNSILGWADILVRQPREADFTQGLQSIDRNARAQAQLIADLLDAARLASGRLQLDIDKLDAVPVFDAALRAVVASAEAKNIEIMRTVDAGPIWLQADPARLQQVIGSLLANAVKHTPKGGRIEAELSRADGQMLLRISDTGIGIDPARLPQLFDGFRGRKNAGRHSAVIGLELLLVRQLLELHGGAVQAESQGKNQGARFTVSLPLDAPAPPAP